MKRAGRSKRHRAARADFIVVTGMSGGGKSHAIRALEDLGYYCVDNLPTPLIPVLADLSRREAADNPKVAVVIRELQAAGRKRMTAGQFAAGRGIAVGDVLSRPAVEPA